MTLFPYLKALASRLLRSFGAPLPPPEDPQASVREPRKRNPGGNTLGVALVEPGDEPSTNAIGKTRAGG